MLILASFWLYNGYMYFYLVSPIKIVRAHDYSFTYSSEDKLPPGTIVIIEVGKNNLAGVVLQEVRQPDFTVKPIDSIVEKNPLPLPLIQTALWAEPDRKSVV